MIDIVFGITPFYESLNEVTLGRAFIYRLKVGSLGDQRSYGPVAKDDHHLKVYEKPYVKRYK